MIARVLYGIGMALIVYGLWLWSPVAALIAGGILICVVAANVKRAEGAKRMQDKHLKEVR